MNFKPTLIAAASLAAMTAPALAQQAPASAPATDRQVLETVVVTSQKRVEDAR